MIGKFLVFSFLDKIPIEVIPVILEKENNFGCLFLKKKRPHSRGIYLNRSKTFVVWINEEDHIRIISIQKGSNLKQVYSRLVKGIKKLEKTLKFVYHEKFGYLTFCPTNIGTGLRASVHVKLPKLAASGKLNQMCESLGLQPRVKFKFIFVYLKLKTLLIN